MVVVEFGRVAETLITASWDGTVRVWLLRDFALESALALRGSYGVGPTFSLDGRWILARSPSRAVVWKAASRNELAAVETGWAALDRGGRLVFVERALEAPQIGEIATDALPRAVPVVKTPEPLVGESRDGKLILTARGPFLGVVRDGATWKEVSILEGHQGQVTGAVFDLDNRWVMTVGEDGSARVWDVATGRPEQEFRLGNRGYGVLISPDGRSVCAVEDSAKITVWDTATWRPRHEYRWPEPPAGGNWAKSAAFSPDGALLAVGDSSGALRILDVADGKTLATIEAHKYDVRTVAFSADGRLVLTAGNGDRGARVWDSSTGARLAEVGTEFLAGAAFSPDGSQVATLSDDGTVRLFNWERFVFVEQLVALAAQRVKRDWTPGERERYLHEATSR